MFYLTVNVFQFLYSLSLGSAISGLYKHTYDLTQLSEGWLGLFIDLQKLASGSLEPANKMCENSIQIIYTLNKHT